MQREEIEKIQNVFHSMKKRIAVLEAENKELRTRLNDLAADQMAQNEADMEVIAMVNTPHPVPRRWLFGR